MNLLVNGDQSETKEKSADKTILSEQERLIERGRARIAYLDRILRAKQAEEKKVKREGRELRRYLQMQLMELIEAPTQGESTKSNGAFSSTAIVPKPNATSELAFCRPRQEVLDNFERFLALDTVPSNASNGTDTHHSDHANGIRSYRKVFATEYDPEEDIMLNTELSLDLGP
ncbi:unnamed protein product, partial [Dicrocoelium dendriticum]